MSTFKNITPEQYRCAMATWPSVHISEDGKTLRIRGSIVHPDLGSLQDLEATIEISADLVRTALMEPK